MLSGLAQSLHILTHLTLGARLRTTLDVHVCVCVFGGLLFSFESAAAGNPLAAKSHTPLENHRRVSLREKFTSKYAAKGLATELLEAKCLQRSVGTTDWSQRCFKSWHLAEETAAEDRAMWPQDETALGDDMLRAISQ